MRFQQITYKRMFANYSWGIKQKPPHGTEQIIAVAIYSHPAPPQLKTSPCQLHFIKYQTNKQRNVKMNTKGRGVALSLQEQTDSWRGCGAQWRQEEGKKKNRWRRRRRKCSVFGIKWLRGLTPTWLAGWLRKCHWELEITACNLINALTNRDSNQPCSVFKSPFQFSFMSVVCRIEQTTWC